MSIVFTPAELINIAISNEKRGISFYDVMAKSADSEEAREIFEGLVAMEREHIRIFEGMLGVYEGHHPPRCLGLGHDMQGQGRLAGRFRAEDLHHPSPGHTADAQGQIQAQRAGGNNGNIDGLILPHPHDGASAELFFNL